MPCRAASPVKPPWGGKKKTTSKKAKSYDGIHCVAPERSRPFPTERFIVRGQPINTL